MLSQQSLNFKKNKSNNLFTFPLILVLLFYFSELHAVESSVDVAALQKSLEASPDNLKMRHTLAKAYFDQNKYDLTVEVLRVKAEKLPQESLTLLALAYQKLNDRLNENKFLEQLTANYPKYAPGFVLLGDFYYRGSLEKNDPRLSMNALAAFKTAIEITPTHRPAYDGLLKAYEKYKNYYELRILLGDMLKRFGKSPAILANLCRRNTLDGYFVNARKTCTEAISMDNSNPENYVYLSLVENNEGDLAKADTLLKKVTSQFPQSEFAASNYADYLIQQKNLPGAENFFRLASKADAKSFRAQIGLARVSFELKHYESALEAYKNACNLNPYQTMKSLKKAADLLRHRRESKLEDRYTSIMGKCITNSDDTRAPASTREEYRSPFALYSKNKVTDSF